MTESTKNSRYGALIVDRDSMSSDLLASALELSGKWSARAIEPLGLLSTRAADDVDLIVIGADLSNEAETGFSVAHSVSLSYPDLPIVILLSKSNRESVARAFRSGARGVFSRQQPVPEFLDCVDHVRKGFIWAGREETGALLEALKDIPAPVPALALHSPLLSARELQVVQHASTGKTNKAIAQELGLSEHTIKNYLFRAFEKLGVKSRVELLFNLTVRDHTLRDRGETSLP